MKNNMMKKLLTLVLAGAMTLSLAACGAKDTQPIEQPDNSTEEAKPYKVAVIKQLDHASLDEIANAVTAELDKIAADNGVTIEYEVTSGQGDQTILKQLSDQAIADGVNAIIPIATTAAQIAALSAEETKTPVVYAAISDPFMYEGFPKSVCTSINDVVCHGIPSTREFLKSGDIVNVDVSTIYKGYFADASRMFMIGEVSPDMQRLVQVTKECRDIGIQTAQPWARLGDVGAAIQEHAEKNGYSVVRDLCGHGCGVKFHEEPDVEHFGKRGTGMLIVPGMTFTIEPMINMGSYEVFIDEADGWTVCTDDGLPSAQWESQILITEDGNEILTQ